MASNRPQQGSALSSSNEADLNDEPHVIPRICQVSDVPGYFIAHMSVVGESAGEVDGDALLQDLEAEMGQGLGRAAANVAHSGNAPRRGSSALFGVGAHMEAGCT